MNTNLNTTTTNESVDIYYQQCFRDIDGEIAGCRERFEIAMLKLGRILTKKESPVFEYDAAKVSQDMRKHRTKIPGSYRPMDIRENLSQHMEGEIVGGGIRVEYCVDEQPRRRNDPPHYSITFSRIYWPEPSQPNPPVGSALLKDANQTEEALQ